LEQIPFEDKSFDIVLSLWVLEHLSKPEMVFDEIFRVLKKESYFIFATPNADSCLLRIKRLIKNKSLIEKLNKSFYGREESDLFPTFYHANLKGKLMKLLASSGFKEIEIIENYDPTYTAFNILTYKLSNIIDHTLSKFNKSLFKHHLIGVAKK
jgi:ubiquinone/menaquinone biosynthesis C-methylase UbiE